MTAMTAMMAMLGKTRILLSRFTSLFRSEKLDRELDDELNFHLDMQTEENLRAGMTPDEARRRAMLSFGGVERVKEEYREKRCIACLRDVVRDIRYGARSLARNPLFAVAAIGTLAFGIGANTAIFSLVDADILHPLPFDHPEELIRITKHMRIPNGDTVYYQIVPVRGAEFHTLRQDVENVDLAAYVTIAANMRGAENAERVSAGMSSANLFSLLRVRPATGRLFSIKEEDPEANQVAIISHGLWDRNFGRAPDVLGKSLMLDGIAYSVVGILPASFEFPSASSVDIWIPTRFDKNYQYAYTQTIGRLNPGAEIRTAEAMLDSVYQAIVKTRYPGAISDHLVATLWEKDIIGSNSKTTILLFFGTAGFVLLIACANTANLLLARTIHREKEMRIRAALGASSARILRQALAEILLLALLGGGFGFALAFVHMKLFQAFLPPNLIVIPPDMQMNPWVFGFTLLVSILTAILVGGVPAWQMTRSAREAFLNEGGRATIRKGVRRTFRVFVAAEIALVLLLLVGAGLFLRSLLSLNRIDHGFQTENILTLTVAPAANKYPDAPAQAAYFERVLERLQSIPDIVAVDVTTDLPFSNNYTSITGIELEGRAASSSLFEAVNLEQVSDGYFRTLQIPLLKGREFLASDRNNTQNVAIVDAAFARRYFPNQNPVGRKITALLDRSWVIVGVVGDVQHSQPTPLQRTRIYLPYLQQAMPVNRMDIVVRRVGDSAQLVDTIRQTLQSIDLDQPAFDIQTMESRIAGSLKQQRTQFFVIGFFAVLALLLAFIGIYGVVAFSVNSRIHEIGVRIALGAQKTDIVVMILRETMLTCACGLLIGAVLAFAATRTIASFLYGVKATDPATFVAAILFVTAVVGIAGLIPALKATAVDPVICLRHE